MSILNCLERIEALIISQNYEEAIELCQAQLDSLTDEQIEGEGRTPYTEFLWWLGLAHVLDDDPDTAETIWGSLLLSGGYEDFDEWQRELLQFLDRCLGRFCRLRQIYLANLVKQTIQKIQEVDPNLDDESTIEDNFEVPIDTTETYHKGMIALWENRVKDAAFHFWDVLDKEPENSQAWYQLAKVYQNSQLPLKAREAIDKALDLEPNCLEFVLFSAQLATIQQDYPQILTTYQKALQLPGGETPGRLGLGQLAVQQGEYETALTHFRQVIAVDETNIGAYLQCAGLIADFGDQFPNRETLINEAFRYCEQVLHLSPENHQALAILSHLHQRQGNIALANLCEAEMTYFREDYTEAIPLLKKIIAVDPENRRLQDHLLLSYCYLKQYEQAKTLCHNWIKNHSEDWYFREKLIYVLNDTAQTDKALEICRLWQNDFPDEIRLKRLENWLIPIVYRDPFELDFYRQHFTDTLQDLTSTPITSFQALDLAIDCLGQKTNFSLNYQGKNDKILQAQYAAFIHQLLSHKSPKFTSLRDLNPFSNNRKIRVGYISDCIFRHTVSTLFMGWLKYADRSQFELTVYSLNKKFDSHTQQYQLFSDQFRNCAALTVEEIAATVIADHLDILVFLDIGMTPEMTFLSCLRLAPIQCITWGHPVTSGSPTMDYFLSSEAMEPENGQDHYTETLVKLPRISIAYTPHALPAKTKNRKEFGLSENRVLYLSGQSLFKYLPQYDFVFAEILRRVPDSLLLFIEDSKKEITERFQARLAQCFNTHGLNLAERCIFLPRLSHVDYLAINLVADVGLDSIPWSGGKTSLDAVWCCLPLVTYPSEFMRGRHTYGILKTLGVEATIAASLEDYINIAVMLGQESQTRAAISEAMFHRHPRLFDDTKVVRALENFYREAITSFGAETVCHSGL